MSKLKYNPDTLFSIRGARYAYEVSKTINNTPGFAPKQYDVKVCEIVIKYDASDNVPYIQFFDYSGILSPEEMQEIIDKSKSGFLEDDFIDPKFLDYEKP